MNLQEKLLARADELAGLPDPDHTILPTGPDLYTIELLCRAANELTRLQGSQDVWQMLHGARVRMAGGENE